MNATQHLSDEQFAALLATPAALLATPGNDPHLQACPQCRAELASMSSSLADLRTAITSLAATTPLPAFDRQPVVQLGGNMPHRWLTRHSIAAGFASILVVVAGSLAVLHPQRPAVTRAAAPPSFAAPFAARPLALSDDALLEGINQDLSTSVPSSLQPLAVAADSSSPSQQK